jgi:S1-C subfamily serine protease
MSEFDREAAQRRDPQLRQPGRPLHRFRTRFVLAGLVGVLAAGTAAGLAFARTGPAPIGTGIVVIETNLAYQNGQAAGTGMVLTRSGEVLTNNHVIKGATTVKIVVPGTRHSYRAKVVGYDVSRDVAVLKARGASNLRTVSLGDSTSVRVGQSVQAVGNAGGTGSLVRVSGTVTGVARAITVSDDQGGTEHLTGLIETNAALEPGDSGGPLLSSTGKVIGMDTAASAGFGFQAVSSSAGFSIPINRALTIAKRIESGKASARIHVGGTAFLGIEVGQSAYDSGALVEGVVSSGPAAVAGLAPGDLITFFGGRAVGSPARLTSLVLARKPGQHVKIAYLDQLGSTHVTTVTLASGPPQ